MGLKILVIITVVSVAFTGLLFVFTGGSRENMPENTGGDGTGVVVELVPTINFDAPPDAGMAKIIGKFCLPELNSRISLDSGVWLVAERIPDKARFRRFLVGPIVQDMIFALQVEPGIYEVMSELPNRHKLSLYSQYVTCGMDKSRCLQHALIQLQAKEGEIVKGVDVCDYEWAR
jgi:hypothetical protein